MTLAEPYTWIKGLHVAAVLTFVGGALVMALAPSFLAPGPQGRAGVDRLREWDRRVTVPAMLMTWTFGLALAGLGHWYGDLWLQAKLVAVATVSGLHGLNSGRLDKRRSDSPWRSLTTPVAVLALSGTIAVLAIVKPG